MKIYIGNKIRELRIKNTMTQKELAQALGVTDAEVSMWELNKRNPSIKHLNVLATSLGVDIEFFKNSNDELQSQQNEIDLYKDQINDLKRDKDFLQSIISSKIFQEIPTGNFPEGSSNISTGSKNPDYTPLKLVA